MANYDTGLGHRLMAGIEREEQDIFNLFVQVANAEYEFASIADFRNRIASSVGYSNAGTNVKSDAAPRSATPRTACMCRTPGKPTTC